MTVGNEKAGANSQFATGLGKNNAQETIEQTEAVVKDEAGNEPPVVHALALAEGGVPCFPCEPRTKRPLTRHGFKDATSDAAQIRSWWQKYPTALVGVPTGSASGMVLIDIDGTPDSVDYILANPELEAARQHNTRRGLHYWFRAPPGETIRCSTSKLARGVDVRGEGGYGIWWPAAGLAASGPDIDQLPELPPRLLERVVPHKKVSTAQTEAASASTDALKGAQNLQRLRELLRWHDPDAPYDEWLRVLMAAHAMTDGSEDALRACDEWSKGSQKYKGLDDLRAHWVTFRNDKAVRVTAAYLDYNVPALPDEFTVIEGEWTEASRTSLRAAVARFTPIADHEFVKRRPLDWHIKKVLPRAELVVVYGQSGSGKSFFVFDQVAAIARGTQWNGHKTTQGRVVYVAAEGANGFRNRVLAHAQQNGGAFPGIKIVAAAPNLFSGGDHVALARAIIEGGGADVIVIDTLSATTPGANENAGEDMGVVIARCKRIHELTGATVILIHHSGKDEAKGARGWSGLRAAIDAEIEVTKNGDTREATITKMKDGEEGAQFAFKLLPVEIGQDGDGEPITSCIVESVALSSLPRKRAEPKPGTLKRTVWDAIRGDISGSGIPITDAVDAGVARMAQPRGRDTRKQIAMEALRALESQGLITIEGDRCRAL